MKITYFFRFLFFWLLFLTIQLSASTSMGEKLPVIASIFPVADMVQQVGGEHVDVTVVLPAGASPHTFEPKPSMVRKFSTSRIFFMIGAGLEFWAAKFVETSGGRIKNVVLSKGIPLIHFAGRHADHNHHTGKADISEHEFQVGNPHIWLDPEIAKSMVNKIVTALCEVDPLRSKYYIQHGKKYVDELGKLDRLIKTTVDTFKIRKYVSFHASWDYFARRYGLTSVGVIVTAPGRDPTPTQIGDIINQTRKHGIRALFAEPQLNPKAAEVIASEANVKILLLDPLGGPKLKNRNTYLDLMKYNLNILERAMK
ncbi:metal ABC transporter substrate-binding protein [Thermodesulfobacteriota bacterium]